MKYVELHCHSAFSLLDGASSPEALVERAQALGHPALALTDHDDLGGIVRFAGAAELAGIGGIIGAELTVRAPDGPAPNHLVLLAETAEGYGNIATLITRGRMDSPRGQPGVSLDTVARHARGLYALTGCPRGWVPSLVAAGDLDGACEATAALRDIFEGRVAIECWDHHLPEEREVVRGLLRIARALDMPWAVTNDVHYATPPGRIVHDVLSAIRHERTLDEMGTRLRPNGEWYLKSAAQMRRRWQHAPEGIRATLEIAERCAFRLGDLRPTLPGFPLPSGVTADEYLARLVEQGAHERWGNAPTEAHARQLAHELGLIAKLGLAGFFLIVWDIVRFARREGVLCQGRGSAANSAVCYCLGITAIDPVKMGLLFERFLTEERKEAPDIDLDFAHRDREKVLQYVYERYGREHAAMVCEQISYRGRSAVRDAARVLGFSVEQANALSLLADRFSARATAERLGGEGGDRGEGIGERDEGRGTRDEDAAAGGSAADAGAECALAERALAERALADALSSRMIHGTEAMTRTIEEKDAARRDGGIPRKATAREKGGPGADGPMPTPASPVAAALGSHLGGGTNPSEPDDRAVPHTPRPATQPSAPRSSPLPALGLDPADPRVRALTSIVQGLHDIPRHRSIHVGGFVLTAQPLSTIVPIEPASMADRTVIQWEKDDLDPIGLVKIDLLGLGMLTVLQDCLKYVRQTRGVTIDLAQLEMTDQAVYDDLCRADTIGLFQVESRAQMNTLPRLKPRCFYDLVVEVALIRPGPIQGEMVHPYLRRRAGEEEVTYPHPTLEPILRRTLGVPLFQEQGMQVAITAAGFTPGEADALRRAMGHKRSHERMAAICERLIEGMRRNGIPEETGRRIYNQINAFADYGFPESHAASFALIVYASAWLRHYYTPEFTAAILNAQPMGFYAPGTLIEDARRHGVEVRPVDLTKSEWDCTLEERRSSPRPNQNASSNAPGVQRAPAVRLGVRMIRGLGTRAKENLERALTGGPFTSIGDVVRRIGFDRRALRSLAEAGALDAFAAGEPDLRRRRAALWEVLEEVRGEAGPLAPARAAVRPPPVPAMAPAELTEADYRMTGVSLNGHPMRHLRPMLAPNGVLSAREVARTPDGARIAVAGLVICRQRPGTAKGFVFLTLEDETGLVNIVVTPKRFERQALLLTTSPLLLVRGVLEVEGRVRNLKGEQFRELMAGAGEEWAPGHDFH
ncbi:MAG TPA: PHP domain-containing protein [Gemmatimonadaceae bacterium]|nr:PHP domain-containing protein [Gemmatimonadaceae bacterium]